LTNGAKSRPCLHGHDRASEETKGIIPRGLPWKAAVGGECRACPAVLYPLLADVIQKLKFPDNSIGLVVKE
jgi:hypothetical protein